MNARDFAFVGVRLIAIYLAFHAIYSVASAAEAVVALNRGAFGADVHKAGPFVYYGVISTFLYLFSSLVLWFGAGPLAKAISPGKVLSKDQGGLRVRELQAIAFSAVGLLILVSAVPKIGGELYTAYSASKVFDVPLEVSFADKARQIQLGIETILGVGLLIWGGKLAGFLAWFRNLGLTTKTSNNRLKRDARKRRAP